MPKRRMPRHLVAQPTDESYKIIPLTQGQNALVDATDYAMLNQWNWCAVWYPLSKTFYAQRDKDRGEPLMHRLILECKIGEQGDHRNHNGLDNRRFNLRTCSPGQNRANQRLRKNNTSGYKGVSWDKSRGKWQVGIKPFGEKRRALGRYSDKETAARAYDEAARRLFGEFALTNFP